MSHIPLNYHHQKDVNSHDRNSLRVFSGFNSTLALRAYKTQFLRFRHQTSRLCRKHTRKPRQTEFEYSRFQCNWCSNNNSQHIVCVDYYINFNLRAEDNHERNSLVGKWRFGIQLFVVKSSRAIEEKFEENSKIKFDFDIILRYISSTILHINSKVAKYALTRSFGSV